jgi:hypothetical protein
MDKHPINVFQMGKRQNENGKENLFDFSDRLEKKNS